MSAVVEVAAPQDIADMKLANELYNVSDLDGAWKAIDQYLMRAPDDAQALTLASAILKKANKPSIAYSLAKRATEIAPHRSETWNAFAHCCQHLWKIPEAEANYRKAIQRAKDKSHKATYLNNLASCHIDMGRFADAEPIIRESIAFEDSHLSRHNLGLALLAQHKWQEGWENYSSSIGTANRLTIKYRGQANPEPVWDGAKDKTVAIYGEQGLGDEICAASMLPDAIADSKRVIIDCDKRLTGLMKRSFPKATVHGTRWAKQLDWPAEDREIDASIAGFEIARYYRKTTESFPGTPYIIPDPDRMAMWKGLFASKGKPTIGIAWSGGTWHNAGLHRQMPLADWKPIFDAIDAHWVSLQYKDASAEIKGTPVVQYPYGTLTQDYDDTAALVASCDLVIAVQTSVNHLAGAMGVPAWAMIPKVSQWRYGEDGDSIPWYKSLKLYRQSVAGQWPVERIARDLKALFG
jgi:tetratricopeptide (TPR) repeat protein